MIVDCPHCFASILIAEVNCAIFRHGVFKETHEQIPPHLPKEECDALVRDDRIFGCGKPFKLVDGKAVECEYI